VSAVQIALAATNAKALANNALFNIFILRFRGVFCCRMVAHGFGSAMIGWRSLQSTTVRAGLMQTTGG
jgi:hypothetical protein